MSIDLAWYQVDTQEVLHYIFYPNWSWSEIYQLKKRADSMLRSSKHAIPVFFDFSLAPQLPPGMLNHGRQIVETRHPQGSPLVIVGGEKVIYNTFKIAERMLNNNHLLDDVAFVPTMREAERFIRSRIMQPSGGIR